MSVTFSNASFALVGGLTGATACAFPSELLDWTSADVIELARPLFLPKHGGAMGVIELVELPESPVQYQLDEIKRKSGLTWGQLADAMGVDARAVHLWRRGGGISAAHEERLQEMNALINSIDLGVPADVRAELVEAAPGGSLLERLRAGDFPRPLIAASPWRSRARAEVDRNVAERENDGIVDEDYVFLLYLESDAVRAFAAGGAELLDDPGATRRAWESLIDAQFAGMRQPEPIPVEAAEEVARRPQMTRVESSPSSAPPTSASLSGSGRSRLAGRSTRAVSSSMYLRPAPADPLLFGDVFSSEWLFDAVINEDAIALAPIKLSRGQGRGYAPMTPEAPFRTDKDFLLAHGTSCRAVLLSDDCEIETCLVRKEGKSRLVFAAVSPWPVDAEAAAKAASLKTFRRHPLQPDHGFEGGVVELYRLFAVSGQALLKTDGRVVGLGDEARAALEQRWAAFATRRGPLVAADNATKLAHVLDARGDAARFDLLHGGDALPSDAAQDVAKAVARTLNQAWRTEGEIMQKVADVHETRSAGNEEMALLESELRRLGELATSAADQLQAQLGRS